MSKFHFRKISAIFALALVFVLVAVSCTTASQAPTQTGSTPTNQTSPIATPSSSTSVPTGQQPVVEAPKDIRSTTSDGVEYRVAVPMTQMVKAKRAPVRESTPTKVCTITWGADEATVYANGNSRVTQPGSIFAQEGLNIELCREDYLPRAVDKVISGETPYLRGTSDMIMSAIEALKAQGIEMELIHVLSRSTGGDTITVQSSMVKTSADLCGKPIGVQLYGPHMYYIARVLIKDAGCPESLKNIRWLRELRSPLYTPPLFKAPDQRVVVDPVTAMQRDPSLAAVTAISVDMLTLSSGGTVGTGAEGSAKGAILLSDTRSCTQCIFDWYVVRTDYLETHPQEVWAFVHGLLRGQQELVALFNAKDQRQEEYNATLKASADILLGDATLTADVEGMYQDMTFMGYRGNVEFFTDPGNLRGFEVVKKEVEEALIGYGLLSGPVSLTYAKLDYAALAKGLNDTANVSIPEFNPEKVQQYVSRPEVIRKSGFVEYTIAFDPGAVDFNIDLNTEYLDEALQMAAVYGGALIPIEGHADCGFYNTLKARGASKQELDQILVGAKNTSKNRADAVQYVLMEYAKARNIRINESQFATVGVGCEKPLHLNTVTPLKTNPDGSLVYGPDGVPVYDASKDTPEMKQKRAENRRVVFKFIPAVAEVEEG